ncbi:MULTISPECIES: hypothetical protein [Streptomyces]|nr:MULTISPECIES: hypothetical protein [unclassified Streptomyces]
MPLWRFTDLGETYRTRLRNGVTGDLGVLTVLMSVLDDPDPGFAVVTP